MKPILLLLLLALPLLACGGQAPAAAAAKPLTGDAVAASLQKSGLPVRDVRVFTAETDPNKLLGRPNQYTVKVNWKDERSADDDATVEVFPDAASLKARRDYTEAISKSGAMFAQYIYSNDARRALLRLPHQLTPDQAKGYEAWLGTL